MRLMFIADGRSPIAINWIRHFVQAGHEIHLISTFPCELDLPLKSISFCSVAFSGQARPSPSSPTRKALGDAKMIGVRAAMRHWLGPFTVLSAARQVRSRISDIEPDLIHAMRIPFEGMLAAAVDHPAPLLLSVWGNDFTLHAPASPWMKNLTRKALIRTDALHVDCDRDKQLAYEWGLDRNCPVIVLPGAGGIREEVFYSIAPSAKGDVEALPKEISDLSKDAFVVVNPRGFRAYIRNDTFFQAIPKILSENPNVIFLCPAMEGEPSAEKWVKELNIQGAVRLMPKLDQEQIAAVFRRSHVAISLSEHDGTPNTLLETMASGCFPIAGDLDSIREWIVEGENGLLVHPGRPEAVAQAVLRVINSPALMENAQKRNSSIIKERATYNHVMSEAEDFYVRMIE